MYCITILCTVYAFSYRCCLYRGDIHLILIKNVKYCERCGSFSIYTLKYLYEKRESISNSRQL